MIMTPLQKWSNNVGDLGKIIVATSFEWLPKVQKITQSGHTAGEFNFGLMNGQANPEWGQFWPTDVGTWMEPIE